MTTNWQNTVVCPGCGWAGTVDDLADGSCPTCAYENNEAPHYRMETLGEILAGPTPPANDVDLHRFLRGVVAAMREGGAE